MDTVKAPQITTSAPTILQRLAQGESAAYDELSRQYGRWIRVLVRRFYSPKDSEFDDAMQEAMMAIWQAAAQFDPTRGSEITYISVIVRSRMISKVRKSVQRKNTVQFTHAVEPASVDCQQPDADTDLQQALDRLAPVPRKLIVLAFVEGMSRAEIALTTGLDKRFIKYVIQTTIVRLRRDLTRRNAA